jgi:hypothetical protein
MRAERIAHIVAGIGLAACALGAVIAPVDALRSWLWSYWFWLGISIGSAQILMLYQLVGGAWGYVTQRILEAATRVMPVMFLLALPLIAGMTRIYSYTDPRQVAANGALQHKAAYLNTPFVLLRLAIYFLVWWLVSHLLTRWSDEQDRTGDLKYTRWRTNLSGPGIIAVSLTVSFMAVDWFMALEPSWYSTMYPGFYVVGQALTAFAFTIIVLHYLARTAPVSEVASPEVFHDLGNLLLTFVVLWAYVQLAQLIITFNGNLPKEIQWYLRRTQGEWAWIAVLLAVTHFFFPFFLLLSRRNKLDSRRLAFLAALVLVVHLIDNYWNVEPAFHATLWVSWLDLAAPVAIGGVWVALVLRQLRARPLLPLHDPRVAEALEKA